MKTTDSFIEDFVQRLKDAGLVNSSYYPMHGCSDEQIKEIESKLKVSLPPIYKKFLSVMGQKSGDFLRGSDFWYPELLTLRQGAESLLHDLSSSLKLPQSAFVFGMHQGYQFFYFDTSDGDDPPVYYYLEGDEEFSRKFDHYSEFLLAIFSDEVAVRKDADEVE
jgi:hypothetical protein